MAAQLPAESMYKMLGMEANVSPVIGWDHGNRDKANVVTEIKTCVWHLATSDATNPALS